MIVFALHTACTQFHVLNAYRCTVSFAVTARNNVLPRSIRAHLAPLLCITRTHRTRLAPACCTCLHSRWRFVISLLYPHTHALRLHYFYHAACLFSLAPHHSPPAAYCCCAPFTAVPTHISRRSFSRCRCASLDSCSDRFHRITRTMRQQRIKTP